MLLSEMVRRIKNEQNLVSDPTQYATASTSYYTVASYNISLSRASLMIYKYEIANANAGFRAQARLKIGDRHVGGHVQGGTAFAAKGGMFYLPAGSYTIEVQLRTHNASYSAYLRNFELGMADFADMAYVAMRGLGGSTLTLPSRRTVIGRLKRGTLYIEAYCTVTPPLTINGAAKGWTFTDWENYVYCQSVNLDSSYTISVGTDPYHVTYSAILCPWILPPSDAEIVDLGFPQGSTLYLVLEPLRSNPIKYLKLGKRRAVSFGDLTDYYSTASGTDILTWNYTFEIIEVSNCLLLISGYGGCISTMACDIR